MTNCKTLEKLVILKKNDKIIIIIIIFFRMVHENLENSLDLG